MIVLVVYYQVDSRLRPTLAEHLRSFGRYAPEEVYYLNAAFGVPRWIGRVSIEAVVFHYSFLATKWSPEHFRRILARSQALRLLPAYKAALPQDEYIHSEAVCGFLRDFGVKAVFSVAPPDDLAKIYASVLRSLDSGHTVLTGYIDEDAMARVARWARPARERALDIGYRGRKVPFWLGRRAQIKWRMADPVREAAEARGLRTDISCDPAGELRGDDWYRFLCDCRVALGCEGGAGVLDPAGRLREAVEAYERRHPGASFEEVEAACLRGHDDTLDLFVLSPRQLDCCMTRTCQVLIEGRYSGVLEPGRHYIPLKRDLSNLEEVLRQVEDVEHCDRIAETAYREVAASGRYTYRDFVRVVLDELRPRIPPPARRSRGAALARPALRARDAISKRLLRAREWWLAATRRGTAGRN